MNLIKPACEPQKILFIIHQILEAEMDVISVVLSIYENPSVLTVQKSAEISLIFYEI